MSFQLQQLSLSTNLVILATAGAVLAYGMLAGHAKVRNLAMSTYVGIVLAETFGKSLHHYLSSNHHGLSQGIVNLILFGAPIILLEISRRHHSRSAHAGMIVTIILSLLTAGLITGMGMAQLDAGTVKHVTGSSLIAFEAYTYRLWLVAIVPIFIVAEAFIGQRQESKKH